MGIMKVVMRELETSRNYLVMIVNYGNNFEPPSDPILCENYLESEISRKTTLPFVLDTKLDFRKNSLYPIMNNTDNP